MEQMMKGFEAILAAQNLNREGSPSVSRGKSPSSGRLHTSSSRTQSKSILGAYDGDLSGNAHNEGTF